MKSTKMNVVRMDRPAPGMLYQDVIAPIAGVLYVTSYDRVCASAIALLEDSMSAMPFLSARDRRSLTLVGETEPIGTASV